MSGQPPSLSEPLEIARGEKSVVLRREDGGGFLLTEIDGFEQEVERTRRNEELMALLDRRSAKEATLTIEQARKELGLR